MSIIDSLKSVFKKKKSNPPPTFIPIDGEIISDLAQREALNENINIPYTDISYQIIDINPNVYLCNKAARLSVGKEELETEEGRLKHIQGLVQKGHESVLEHSNIISMITIPYSLYTNKTHTEKDISDIKSIYVSIIELLSNSRYLQVVTKIDANLNYVYILIGGSIRGYLNAIRESDACADIIELFKDIMYSSINKEFLSKLIDQGILKEDRCNYVSPSKIIEKKHIDENGEEVLEAYSQALDDPEIINGKCSDLIYAQDFIDIYHKVHKYGFDIFDVLKVTTITFLYHDISRSIGNQLVRHRVGITQSSQRYVLQDNTKCNFIDPILDHLRANSGKYDELPELAQIRSYLSKRNPFAIYTYLINHGISKEDARMWLPLGVSTKIIMTFTYKQFMKFLDLRTANSAQFEIRNLAKECQDQFIKKFHLDSFLQLLLQKYSIMPKVVRDQKLIDSSDSEILKEWINHIEIDEVSDTISEEPLQAKEESNVKIITINTIEDAEKYLIESSKNLDDE